MAAPGVEALGDYISGGPGNDLIDGGDGTDNLYGDEGNDTISGGAGGDYINGGPGNNVIDGGPGDDKIVADDGTNTIIINSGSGFDEITSHFISAGEQSDTVVFGPGITPEDLQVQMDLLGNQSYIDMKLAIGIGDDEGLVITATQTSTVMLNEIGIGLGLYNVNGALMFVGNDGIHGSEFWKSDGTDLGTVMVKDIWPGPEDGADELDPRYYVVSDDGTLFFSACDGVHGVELWKSDGTEAGTVMVKDSGPGTVGIFPYYLTDVNGVVFFRGYDDVHGTQLWKSDGTEAGTFMVKDINQGPYAKSSKPDQLTNVNGTLFFAADDGLHGIELWKSDGTAGGTVLVKDIYPGLGLVPNSSNPHDLIDVNGTLFFTAWDGVHGNELWKSDGTEAGTVMVKDMIPGTEGASSAVANVNGSLFFIASNGVRGELWKTDGTEAGTVMVKDFTGFTEISHFTTVNDNLFFTANDGVHGF